MERRTGFEKRILQQAASGLNSLTLQERLAIGLGRLKAQRGLTNRNLADKLGVHEAYISQITRAMRDVKTTTLDKMMRELDVSLEELFTVREDDLARMKASHLRRKKRNSVDDHSEN